MSEAAHRTRARRQPAPGDRRCPADAAGVLRELAELSGLREGTIGLAPLSAVLSFLRSEGAAYDEITARAGVYAAEWTVRGLPAIERRLIGVLPAPLRARAALRAARALVRATYPGSRAHDPSAKGHGVDRSPRLAVLRGARSRPPLPLCGYYAAAIARVLQLFAIEARRAGRRVPCRRDAAGLHDAVAVAPPAVAEVRREHAGPDCCAVLLVGVLLAAAGRRRPRRRPRHRILVMPFDNPHREPRLHWIAEAASLLRRRRTERARRVGDPPRRARARVRAAAPAGRPRSSAARPSSRWGSWSAPPR